ncbi:MAG: hypothetical protein HOG89_03100 [Candidatus Peribacter sp.]|jgi:hypothetical protein|nr:hypothetical protein [Candidatus Peribacter sp.]MBT4392654.1 hypothetical protein [Candidatus Peribacter sp.]MBT4600729.1 hypothetical protein [Candidatus Peribacter sp.]MBT5148602.1 hypothetical protein [Candidatus Peribacter sp.]MBT5637802.1 hypothetical protein [Candidatus Peribacter sp.]
MSIAELDVLGVQVAGEQQSEKVTAEEFAVLLMQFSVDEAARRIIFAEPDMYYRREIVRLIPDEQFQYDVANTVFGEKLAGDIGARTCATHPKTDYGDPCCKDLMSDK